MNDLFRQRVKIGYNVCARVLTRRDTASPKPLLVVLPSTPQSASLPWNYIPSVCHEQNIPLFFYQGSDQSKLAQLLHLKQVSVVVFVARAKEKEEAKNRDAKGATAIESEKHLLISNKDEEDRFHNDVDSFLHFVLKKIPGLRLVPRENSSH